MGLVINGVGRAACWQYSEDFQICFQIPKFPYFSEAEAVFSANISVFWAA
jgi:hypothetical protein